MLIGAASQNLSGSDFIALDLSCGPFNARRSYQSDKDFTATSGVPTSFAASNAAMDVNAGYVSVYSFKPDVTKLGNGDLDDEINAFLASIPAGHKAILSTWHEGAGKARQKLFTVAAWKKAFQRFADLVHMFGNPDLSVALILEAYQPPPEKDPIGTTYDKMWPGDGYADYFFVDGYTDLGTGASVWAKAAAFALLHDIPWGIAELGQRSGAVDAVWMAEQARYAVDNNAAALLWFASNGGGVTPTPGSDTTSRAVAETISILLSDV